MELEGEASCRTKLGAYLGATHEALRNLLRAIEAHTIALQRVLPLVDGARAEDETQRMLNGLALQNATVRLCCALLGTRWPNNEPIDPPEDAEELLRRLIRERAVSALAGEDS
jgi:hypothetical protein